MRILGIFDDHNCGTALIEDGKILWAIEEERLSRIKLHNGNSKDGPVRLSLRECLRLSNSDRSNIDRIAAAIAPPKDLLAYVLQDLIRHKNPRWLLASLVSKSVRWDRYFLFYPYFYNARRVRKLKSLLREVGLAGVPIDFMDHHTAHAASAYYASGRRRALIVTLDGQGDGLCGKVLLGENGRLRLLKEVPSYHSIGLFYNFITWLLGFKPMRHEGKITGLAAHGTYETTRHLFEKLFTLNDNEFRYLLAERLYQHAYPHRSNYVKFKNAVPPELLTYPPEQIAAGVQGLSERLVSQYVDAALQQTGPIDVCLAGGVFANVRINQKVAELPNAQSVFIFPAMGDGGLCAGAALYSYYQSMGFPKLDAIPQLQDVYLGPEFTEDEIVAEIKKAGLKYTYHEDIESVVADLLAKGKVVARFNGRMEYGPRALGNRSILYQATDPTVNDWLNHRLRRTEFMPFAPATLAEEAHRCYKNVGRNYFPAKFMTITFDCTSEMKRKCPAVVHVDNTARPQLVDEKTNPSFYRIIKEYYRRTGLNSIINTSFNMHEEPIVCSPYDAIRAFQLGHLDYLAMARFLVYSDREVNG
ncbi:MAG: carbamoyltransferase C-terminal domain-containing protein [Candidatus Oleimicrobiaceae bacterium]